MVSENNHNHNRIQCFSNHQKEIIPLHFRKLSVRKIKKSRGQHEILLLKPAKHLIHSGSYPQVISVASIVSNYHVQDSVERNCYDLIMIYNLN